MSTARQCIAKQCHERGAPGHVAHPIASSTSSGNASRHGHYCGFAAVSTACLRLRRSLANTNIFAIELKSRLRPGAICRQEAGDRDRSWPLSAFRTAGTTPGCFHTRRLRPVRPTDPRHRAGSGKPMVRPDGIGDDGPWETEALQARLRNLADHVKWLCVQPERVNNMTKPSRCLFQCSVGLGRNPFR